MKTWQWEKKMTTNLTKATEISASVEFYYYCVKQQGEQWLSPKTFEATQFFSQAILFCLSFFNSFSTVEFWKSKHSSRLLMLLSLFGSVTICLLCSTRPSHKLRSSGFWFFGSHPWPLTATNCWILQLYSAVVDSIQYNKYLGCAMRLMNNCAIVTRDRKRKIKKHKFEWHLAIVIITND